MPLMSQPTLDGSRYNPSRDTFRMPAKREMSFNETDQGPSAGVTPSPPPTLTPPPSHRHRPGKQNRIPTGKDRVPKRDCPKEEVNYPCHYPHAEPYRKKLVEMELYPDDGIHNYTRQIPFKGTKESFLKKTGRARFDVYEYRFTAPDTRGENKHWWIMWDYYNGLVRIHDIFDCCKPGKTEPGNAVKDRVNPGLSDICHNITGGNLHAQGYWLPFEAAKALLAKFCYRIRHALVVIFGEDFPNKCLPENHPDFGDYAIDPNLIAECAVKAEKQYQIEQQRIVELNQRSSSRYASSSENTPAGSIFRATTPEESPVERQQGRRFFDPVRGDYTRASGSTADSQLFERVDTPSTVYNGGSRDMPRSQTSHYVHSNHHHHTANGTVTPTPSPQCRSQTIIHVDQDRSPTTSTLRQRESPIPAQPSVSGYQTRNDIHSIGPVRNAALQRSRTSSREEAASAEDAMARASKRRRRATGQYGSNPYMRRVEHGVETFRNGSSAARINTIPAAISPFTPTRCELELQRQQDEELASIQLLEAAGNLLSLALKDYELSMVKKSRAIHGRSASV